MVRYCGVEWELLVVQICLTLGYICIEIVGRFFTFKFYTRQHYFNDADYLYWHPYQKRWVEIEQKQIKVGQIIKIKQKLSIKMQESNQVNEQAKIRTPVNILPLAVGAGEKYLNIETFDIDKQEAAIKISIVAGFGQYFGYLGREVVAVKPRISDECLIQYTFSNPIS